MEISSLAESAYIAYGAHAQWKNFQGNEMPKWEGLSDEIRDHWVAAVTSVLTVIRTSTRLSDREKLQVAHAVDYVDFFSEAGIPGDSQIKLIAKLADALRF